MNSSPTDAVACRSDAQTDLVCCHDSNLLLNPFTILWHDDLRHEVCPLLDDSCKADRGPFQSNDLDENSISETFHSSSHDVPLRPSLSLLETEYEVD